MLKSVARTTLLTKRQSLTEADCIKLDDLLLIQLQRLDWSSTKIIGSFFPSEIHSEPNSLLFIRFLKMYIPELIVTYPKIQDKDFAMDFFFLVQKQKKD